MKGLSTLFTIIFVFLLFETQAQKGYELGGWVGTSFYYGDLNNRLAIHKPWLAGGLNARYNFNPRVAMMSSLSYGRIAADDAFSPNSYERNRNLSFSSSIFDFSAVLEFNFFNFIHASSDENYTPYIFGGFSVFRFSPYTELNGQTYSLREFGTEGQAIGDEYGAITGSGIIGGGWKWDITNDWSINIHMRYHGTFSDYLDDVSTVYPDKNELLNSRGQIAVDLSDRSLIAEIGETGRQRGNSRDNDSFFFVGISFMKYFGSLECPKLSEIY